MKIAIYTISKNEEKHVERWYNSTKEADYHIIADTGSTDKTVELAKSLGITVVPITIKPWRFDKARNAALDALPKDVDYCIALDMDEVLQPGWRAHLESVSKSVTRPRYSYTWSWNEDGTPGLVYGGDKIHARKGYRWKHPVHEVLVTDGTEVQDWTALEIHHHPDHSKSRGQYLPLLEMAVKEDPSDDRNAFYYARELYFNGDHNQAWTQFTRHLSLPKATWRPERAASMRYLAKLDKANRETWLLRSCAEAPDRREPWVELAQHYYETGNWPGCHAASQRALSITEKPLEYLCEAFAWGPQPHDLAAIAAWNIGLGYVAFLHGTDALALAPDDERLKRNLSYYKNEVADAIL